MKIIRLNMEDDNERVNDFINEAFTDYAIKNEVALNFEEYCFIAEDDTGRVIGSITGRAYYNEVHIGDLIIDKDHRRLNLGSELVKTVEQAYENKGYDKITLTTFGFQAPEFYKKLGYQLEFVREDKNPKLCKYFYCKSLG
ncbi:MAG: GNAT family N-acetyltransferase [Lachnospiraceae bacterium]|nr:GNAT family N-acetyltransferase [Lachnospiraceae bacterium]